MLIELFKIGADGRATIYKDPDALLDYTIDWTDYLAALSADRLADVAFTNSDGTLVLTEVYEGFATAWIEGGTVGETITLTCRIQTRAGRIDACTVYIKVRER